MANKYAYNDAAVCINPDRISFASGPASVEISLGQGDDGIWRSGFYISFPTWGSSSPVKIHDPSLQGAGVAFSHDSKDAATDAVLRHVMQRIERHCSDETNPPTERKMGVALIFQMHEYLDRQMELPL